MQTLEYVPEDETGGLYKERQMVYTCIVAYTRTGSKTVVDGRTHGCNMNTKHGLHNHQVLCTYAHSEL